MLFIYWLARLARRSELCGIPLEENQIAGQMSLKEFIDPFTGSKNTKA